MNYINTWGLYQCFQGVDDEYVEFGDREDFFSLLPNGKVFQCVEMKGENIILKYGERLFCVSPRFYKVIKKPLFTIGDDVEIVEKSLIGKIVDVNWHIKNNQPYYFIEINGKKIKRSFKITN